MITVLIVEDDPMVAIINKTYTEQVGGFNVVGTINNGKDALAFLKKASVDLILLDVFMPQIQGLTVLKHVKKLYPNIDIIMITANRASSDIKIALNYGVVDYIVKPFTYERFQSTLLSYAHRYKILHSTEELTQSVLDKIISRDAPVPNERPPKGISESTLANIKQQLHHLHGPFTINDVANISGFSRISLKKYLDYLETLGELESELLYSSMGRPAKQYKFKR